MVRQKHFFVLGTYNYKEILNSLLTILYFLDVQILSDSKWIFIFLRKLQIDSGIGEWIKTQNEWFCDQFQYVENIL